MIFWSEVGLIRLVIIHLICVFVRHVILRGSAGATSAPSTVWVRELDSKESAACESKCRARNLCSLREQALVGPFAQALDAARFGVSVTADVGTTH